MNSGTSSADIGSSTAVVSCLGLGVGFFFQFYSFYWFSYFPFLFPQKLVGRIGLGFLWHSLSNMDFFFGHSCGRSGERFRRIGRLTGVSTRITYGGKLGAPCAGRVRVKWMEKTREPAS